MPRRRGLLFAGSAGVVAACAALAPPDDVGYADDGGGADAPGDAPDAALPDAGADVALVPVTCGVDGGVCVGAQPVCCLHAQADDQCLAPNDVTCVVEDASTARLECDQFGGCPTTLVCCFAFTTTAIYSATCVLPGNCRAALACNPKKDTCPVGLSCTVVSGSYYACQ
jgi:hypothetical protein